MSPDKKPTLPIDIYVRVSRVGGREGESFISPKVQTDRCKAQLKAKGFKVGQVFEDLDQSGGKMDRPEFEKALARIRSGQSGGIIVHKLDRFARNTVGLLTAVEEIEDHGAAFICVEPGIDTADPAFGRFLLTLFSGLAELELGKIRTAWATAHKEHVDRGVTTGRAPAGYSKDANGRLVTNEHAPTIVEAFEMRSKGATIAQVAAFLRERGVPTSGGKVWQERTAARMLKNRTYLGEIRFGDDLVNPKAHEPIVSLPLWNRVQALFEPGTRKRASKEWALLAGLLRCGSCGGILTVDSTRRKDGSAYRFYRCRNEFCTSRVTISADNVEQYLTVQAMERAGTAYGTEALGNETLNEALQVVEKAQAELDETEALRGKVSPTAFALAYSDAEAALAKAHEAVASAREGGSIASWYLPSPKDPDFDAAHEVGSSTLAVFEKMPVNEKRQVLRTVIDRATVAKTEQGSKPVEDRVSVEWKVPAAPASEVEHEPGSEETLAELLAKA